MVITFQKPLVDYKKFQKLPSVVREFVIDYDNVKKIEKICAKYQFNQEQTVSATRINGLIIIKEIPPADFVVNLQDTLKVDSQTAKNLANDLYQQIIKEAETLYVASTGLPETQLSPIMAQPDAQGIPQPQEAPIRTNSQNVASSPQHGQSPTAPQTKTASPNIDRYMEPIEEPPPPLRPRIDGNVIDLKNQH